MAGEINSPRRGRNKIEDAIFFAEEERKRKLASQRLALARAGSQAFQRRDLSAAIKAFSAYLRVLEETKGVGESGLLPQHFDLKKDLVELGMISGIYWDLCKIYDKIVFENNDFQEVLQKYIQFSKGLPYQSISAETLRKYISRGKPKHRAEFKAAYRMLAASRCFVATSLVDVIDIQTLPVLRKFRDEVLARKSWGRAFIFWYYRRGPQMADCVDRLPQWMRVVLGKGLDLLVMVIRFLSE
jgi:hypothetical protein